MTGDSLLSFMVGEPGQKVIQISLPGGSTSQYWYKFPMQLKDFSEDIIRREFQPVLAKSNNKHNIACSLDKGIPIYLKGGKILLTKERPRRNSELMLNDPYTMYIALDQNRKSTGTLFEDDQKSLNSDYILTHFNYDDSNKTLSIRVESKGGFDYENFKFAVERIIILRTSGQHSVIKRPRKVSTGVNVQVKL